MKDDLIRAVGMPMFGRVLFDPEQPTGGDIDTEPSNRLPENLQAGLDAAAAAPSDDAAEKAENDTPAPAAPPAPPADATAQEKVDWEKKYNEERGQFQTEAQKFVDGEWQTRQQAIAAELKAHGLEIKDGKVVKAGAAPVASDPNAPVTIEQLQKQVKAHDDRWNQFQQERQQFAQRQQQETAIKETSAKLNEAMAKHKDVFDDEKIGDWAVRNATDELSRRVHEWNTGGRKGAPPDVAKVAEDVAKAYSGWIESAKAKYVDQKRNASGQFVPGAASSGGRQAGNQPKEIDLSTREGRREAQRDMQRATAVQDD